MAFIRGNFLSNHLTGGDEDDLLAGLGGDDFLTGGKGRDTAWYGGALSGYQFSRSQDRLVVKDINPGDGNDGTDSLSSIETLQFNGVRIRLAPAEIQVNSFFTGDQVTPSIVALHDGGYLVSWTSSGQDGSGPGVFAQRYAANGEVSGGERQVNTTTLGNQSAPSVAALADGGFVTVWQSFFFADGDGWAVVAQRYDASGNKVGTETHVNTFTALDQFEPQVAELADGGFIVTWTSAEQDGSGNGIYAQRYAPNGETSGSEFRVNTTTDNDQSDSSVAALASGGFVVTWASSGQDGSGFGVFGHRYGVDGNAAGNEFRVNTFTSDSQFDPSVAALANGGFVVTWTSNAQDGDGAGIYAQRFDAAGQPVRTEFQVNTITHDQQFHPSVAGLVDGGFVVTWDSNGQDGDLGGIYGQRFDAFGNPLGIEFRVNAFTTGDQHNASVAGLKDGGFVVSWESAGEDGSAAGIFAERYDPQGVALGLKITGTPSPDVLNLGTGDPLVVDGAGGNDLLTGGAGDDNLFGGDGLDTLNGNAGNDHLDGGSGADKLNGGAGDDEFVVDNAADVLSDGGGNDTVFASVSWTLGIGFENLQLTGAANINATGNAQANLLEGNAGNNLLDGKGGSDLMAGHAGNDTYVVDDPFDIVTEDANEGIDTVLAPLSYVLPDNVENLTLTGVLSMDAVGNQLSNNLLGNSAANTLVAYEGNDNLNGGAGNDVLLAGPGDDVLTGGAGNDILTGGTGNDRFDFALPPSATNVDEVTDFTAGADKLELSKSAFSGLQTAANLNLDASELRTGTGVVSASDANDHILYNSATGDLYYDRDGTGVSAPVQFAHLDAAPAITANDIFVTN